MAEITAALVKELRERTQAGMSDCKNALVEAGGDIDKAVEIILKKGIVKAAARAGRVASEGEVRAVVTADKKRGTIVEINCQTDFVARGDDFKGFVNAVSDVAAKLPKGADLASQEYPGKGKSIDAVRQELVAKTGENCVVRRWDALEGGHIHAYIHAGGKLGVLVQAEAPEAVTKSKEFSDFIDNVAMQIAAMNPLVVDRKDVTEQEIAKQKEIFQAQLKEEGKPEAAWPKIVEGKVNKWFTEVTLLGQDNVWDQGAGTVDKVRQELGKKLGGEIKLTKFVRFSLGEGIEKKTEDLAEEVAKIAGM